MIKRTTLALFTVIIVAQTASGQGRLPSQKKPIVLRSPTTYEKRILRYDAKTGQPVYYDPKPVIVPLDGRSGKYGLRWIGYDGKIKTIIYQRHDALDAVVSASVSKTASGRYLYTYKILNLPSSGQHLSIFALQTFASDVKPISVGYGYLGQFSGIREMREGNWIGFGSTNLDEAVTPGGSVELKVISSAPPGLVECRIAGGGFGMKGVGEEPPEELEAALPGYEAWPKAHTIGPIDNLKSVSRTVYTKYLLDQLRQFRKLGWMTADALRWFGQNLGRDNLGQVYKRAQQDLKAGKITTEVHDIIQAIND